MRIRKCIRSLLSIVLVLALISLVFAGCGETKVSETQIWEDIIAQDNFFEEYGLEITDKEITQRKTMVDQKYDDVYAVITARNSDCIYEAEYSLNYILYDDGWLLEDYFKEGYNTTPRTSCPLSISEEYIREEWNDEISALYFDRKEEEGDDDVHYYIVEVPVSDTMTEVYEVKVVNTYFIDKGWQNFNILDAFELLKSSSYSKLIDKKY